MSAAVPGRAARRAAAIPSDATGVRGAWVQGAGSRSEKPITPALATS